MKLKINRVIKIMKYSWYVIIISQIFNTDINYGLRFMNAGLWGFIGCGFMIGFEVISKQPCWSKNDIPKCKLCDNRTMSKKQICSTCSNK